VLRADNHIDFSVVESLQLISSVYSFYLIFYVCRASCPKSIAF